MKKVLDRIHNALLSEKARDRGEYLILVVAIVSFLIHLAVFYLARFGVIQFDTTSQLLKSPIAAIYTPFSFILIYEVYLLIYYLPQSITTYISKQYEIITLILIRRLFKDLANIELSSNWFDIQGDMQFTYDILTSIVLFFLLYLFYRKRSQKFDTQPEIASNLPASISTFINFKKGLATLLVPLLFGIATYTLVDWSLEILDNTPHPQKTFKDVNDLFFDEFFTILIIVDVILLLLSFFYTDRFHKVIRNSGFIISTILIRLSFSVDGLINNILIVSAVAFGLLILTIHNMYEKYDVKP